MPSVSGNVFFDSTLNNTGTSPIANVPVVLQNTSTGSGLIVLTNASGAFQFDSVPAGTYRLVEAWSLPGGVASPGNFDNASIIPVPDGNDPPVSAITSPPANTNRIASVTQNTLTPITVSTSNIAGQIFRDGPYTNTPIVASDISYIGTNILTGANNGDWGTLPAGTALNTHPATAPYPDVVDNNQFSYTNGTPADGSYTVTNTSNLFGQGFIADHTQGDETGRFQVVNGANPGNSFFTQTLPVSSNSFYQFSAWMLNLTGGALPQLGYQIKTLSGGTLFQANAPAISLTSPRTWLELGTFFNSGNNTALVIKFLSQGPAAGGNDYAMDDFSLVQVSINDILTSTKTVDKDYANVGDTLDYQVVLTNTGSSTITNLVFVDTIPLGTSFNGGTVRVNGTTVPTANPAGFSMPTPPMPMLPNEVITVNFKVTVNTIPTINPIPNSVTTNYAFAPINGQTTVPNAVASSIVTTQVNNGDLSATKIVDKTYAKVGDIVTYTIPISNVGNTTALNIILIDTIPSGTSFVTDSLIIDGNTATGVSPSPPGASIGTIPAGGISTVSFKVIVTTIPSPNPFVNNATLNYDFVVDPVTPVTVNSGARTNTVSTKVNTAIVSEIKTVNKSYATVGDTIIYTVVFKNTGNVTATNVSFIDTIPNDTTFVPNSLVFNNFTQPGANPSPPNGFTLGTIPVGGTATVTFNVTVNTIPSPNPIPNTSTGTYTYTIDPSVPNDGVGNLNTNQVTTTVNFATLGNINKSVDKTFATCGDTLSYTVTIPNSGNITAFNVFFKDTIPSGTSFVPNSFVINGIGQPGANPVIGVNLGTIPAGAATVVFFEVLVNC